MGIIFLILFKTLFWDKIQKKKQEKEQEEKRKREKAIEDSKPLKVTFDYSNSDCYKEKNFNSLVELAQWLFEQSGYKKIIPPGEILKRDQDGIVFECDDKTIAIIYIEDPRGILFSNGACTSGVKHCSEEINNWVEHFSEHIDDLREIKKEIHLVE